MAKEKRQKMTTPVGILRYAYLNKPTSGSEKFKLQQPQYKTDIILTKDDARELFKALKAAHAQGVEANKTAFLEEQSKKPKSKQQEWKERQFFKPELDEAGEETGKVVLTMKMYAHDKEGGLKKVPIFNAMGVAIANPPAIFGGTKAVISFNPHFNSSPQGWGLSLWLNAVQIIDLVSSSGGNAESYGFSKQEGGWAGDDDATVDVNDGAGSSASDDDAPNGTASATDDDPF